MLDLNGEEIPFELKSTTTGSVTTVRDFGRAHLEKWKDKHWLIGVYDPGTIELEYALYGSPDQMATWIAEKEEYIRPDFELAVHAPARLTVEDMYEVLGIKATYSLADARKLHNRHVGRVGARRRRPAAEPAGRRTSVPRDERSSARTRG